MTASKRSPTRKNSQRKTSNKKKPAARRPEDAGWLPESQGYGTPFLPSPVVGGGPARKPRAAKARRRGA